MKVREWYIHQECKDYNLVLFGEGGYCKNIKNAELLKAENIGTKHILFFDDFNFATKTAKKINLKYNRDCKVVSSRY